MGVTMLPGAPQFGQGGNPGGVDVERLGQLMLAVKQHKMEQAEMERVHAQQSLQVILQNPAILAATDPKDIDKFLKKGYDLIINDDPAMNLNGKPQVTPQDQKGSQTVTPQNISAVGNAAQGNKSGAQAGAPASPEAANKNPGGGVSKVGASSETLAANAKQVQGEKMNHLAGLYGGAVDAMAISHAKAQSEVEIEHLKQAAAGGDPRAVGRLILLSGKPVTDADLRAIIATSSGDPAMVGKALDVALGNETDSDKAKRFDSTLKTLTQSPEVLGKLENPLDVANVAKSIVYGGTLPEGVAYKNITMGQLKDEAEYEKTLIQDQGLPYEIAHLVSRGRTLGIPPSQSVPPAFQGLLTGKSLSERKTRATEVTAGAAALSSKADMIKAQADYLKATDAHSKIDRMLALDENKEFNTLVKSMIEADKAKHPWPDDLKQGILDKVAGKVDMTPTDVNNWFNFITGGTHREYKAGPSALGVLDPNEGLPMSAAEKAGAQHGTVKVGTERSRSERESRRPAAEALTNLNESLRERRQRAEEERRRQLETAPIRSTP